MAKNPKSAPNRKTVKKAESHKVHKALPGVWTLTKKTAAILWINRTLFLGIAVVYALLTLVFVGVASNANITNLKQSFDGNSSLVTGIGLFINLIGTSGSNSNAAAGAYQFMIAIIASLAIIWAYRQVVAGVKIRVRDSYYKGMYGLVPFVIILIIIGLQLLPLLIGSAVYGQVMNNGIAVAVFEKLLWGMLFGISALISLYMLSSTIFALYISALPDMTPVKALRSAHDLVKGRRIVLIRKILYLPLLLLVLSAIIMLPFIIWMTALAQVVFFMLGIMVLLVVHGYFYVLYRELINE